MKIYNRQKTEFMRKTMSYGNALNYILDATT